MNDMIDIEVSIENIERAVKIAARIVKKYGDVYLPVFTRMNAELIKAKEIEASKALAFQLVQRYAE